MTVQSNVRVAIRIRPFISKERLDGSFECINKIEGSEQVVVGEKHTFTFDHVFDAGSTQEVVYEQLMKPLIGKFMDGYNSTVFAYGQTGSGKTFTIGTGIENINDDGRGGIIPRSVHEIFCILREKSSGDFLDKDSEYQLYVSFIEVYNETIRDLLCKMPNKTNLVIREDPNKDIYLVGLVEERVYDIDVLYEYLKKGIVCRTTGSTEMNTISSRSHAIFTIIFRQPKICGREDTGPGGHIVSKLNFVDLAGSERYKKTNAAGERFKESVSINSGLLALGNVITALGDTKDLKVHVPYRNSKLTRLLQNSLGGNSQTIMIACVSPSNFNMQESINTLQYANRAKNIVNRVSINEDFNSSIFEINILKKQIMGLKKELFTLRKKGNCDIYTGSNIKVNNANVQINSRKIQGIINENTDLKLLIENRLHDTTFSGLKDFKNKKFLENFNVIKNKIFLLESVLFECGITSIENENLSVGKEDNIDRKKLSFFMEEADSMARQDLERQLEVSRDNYVFMKSKYEEKFRSLRDLLETVKREKEELVSNGRKSISSCITTSVRENMSNITRSKYEEQIRKLTRSKENTEARYQKLLTGYHNLSNSNDNRQEQVIENLKRTIENIKTEKSRVIYSLNEEIKELRSLNEKNICTTNELKLSEKDLREELKKYKKKLDSQRSLFVKLKLGGGSNISLSPKLLSPKSRLRKLKLFSKNNKIEPISKNVPIKKILESDVIANDSIITRNDFHNSQLESSIESTHGLEHTSSPLVPRKVNSSSVNIKAMDTGFGRRESDGLSDPFTSLSFNHSNTKVGGFSEDNLQNLGTLSGYNSSVSAMCSVANHLYGGSKDGCIKVWDIGQLSLLKTVVHSCLPCVSSMWCDSRFIYVSGKNVIRVWDHNELGNDSAESLSFSLNASEEISALFVRDNLVYTGSNESNLAIFDIRKQTSVLRRVNGIHKGTVFSIESFKHDGCTWIVTGSRDHNLRVYKDDGNYISSFYPPHYDAVQSVICMDGNIVSGSRDRSIKRWRLTESCSNNTPSFVFKGSMQNVHANWITSMVGISPDRFLSSSRDGIINCWALESDETRKQFSFRAHELGISCLNHVSENLFASGSQDKTIKLWKGLIN